MELKIICQCGQKYKFDVEPAGGRMPFTVNCPVCQADGTATANTRLAEHFKFVPPPPRATAPPQFAPSVSAPAPGGPPPPSMASAPPPQPVGGLRISHQAPAATPPPVAMAISSPPPAPISGIRPAVNKSKPQTAGEFSLVRGIMGALIGAVVGCGLLVAFWIWAGFRFPLSGIAVGVAAGYGARLMARGTDTTLGFITAGIAAASVIGTFIWMYGGFPVLNIISVVVCVSAAYRVSSE